MTIDNLYEQIAQNIQDGLNATSEVFEFSVKTMYNEQRPDNPNIFVGTLSYTPADIIPLAGVTVLELNGSVSFVVKKEQAAEINAVLQSWLGAQQGVVGETISLSFFATWQLVQSAVLTNETTTQLDGKTLPVLSKSIAKQKNVQSDNKAGFAYLQGEPVTQGLAFEYTAYLTNDFSDIVEEILATDYNALTARHTLTETIGNTTQTYTVSLQSGTILGSVGGIMTVQLYFVVAYPLSTG